MDNKTSQTGWAFGLLGEQSQQIKSSLSGLCHVSPQSAEDYKRTKVTRSITLGVSRGLLKDPKGIAFAAPKNIKNHFDLFPSTLFWSSPLFRPAALDRGVARARCLCSEQRLAWWCRLPRPREARRQRRSCLCVMERITPRSPGPEGCDISAWGSFVHQPSQA